MARESMKQTIQDLFDQADIKINGNRPWDIKVNNPGFYSRVLAGGSLALGESYMDCWWDCKALDEFFYRILKTRLDTRVRNRKQLIVSVIKAKIMNLQSRARAYEVGKRHYDIGNDLYKVMLDKRMVYSCGYWENAKTLDKAQEAKLDLICKKLKLKPGMKILDIGCGWGSFAKYAAQKYKVKVVGITVSKEQVKLAQETCKGLPVEIRLQDYRNLKEKFDHIVSVGMFEHVGHKNYRTYMEAVYRCLKPRGLFLLHTIGRDRTMSSTDPWVHKYIFPNGILPSPKQITESSEGLFVLEDWHNFSSSYEKTLMAWHHNFSKNWNSIKDRYSPRFYRMWRYYLLSYAGVFRNRQLQLWQIVFSKKGSSSDYESIR